MPVIFVCTFSLGRNQWQLQTEEVRERASLCVTPIAQVGMCSNCACCTLIESLDDANYFC